MEQPLLKQSIKMYLATIYIIISWTVYTYNKSYKIFKFILENV